MGDDEGHDVEAKEGCTPLQASAFRKNTNIILKDKPCKVVEMSTSKTGKHGHAKVNFTGIDIFTNKKYKEIQGSTHNMLTFESKKTEWGIMDMTDEGTLFLIDEEGNTREDLTLPADEELADQIRKAYESLPEGKEVFLSVLAVPWGYTQVMSFIVRDAGGEK